jgi:hypothetical protein
MNDAAGDGRLLVQCFERQRVAGNGRRGPKAENVGVRPKAAVPAVTRAKTSLTKRVPGFPSCPGIPVFISYWQKTGWLSMHPGQVRQRARCLNPVSLWARLRSSLKAKPSAPMIEGRRGIGATGMLVFAEGILPTQCSETSMRGAERLIWIARGDRRRSGRA